MIVDATPSQYNLPVPLIKRISVEKSVPASLIAAVIIAESGGRKYAAQYQPGYQHVHDPSSFARELGITSITEIVHQRTSVGLMQIMFATARGMGYRGHYAPFYDPEINIRYGAEYLKRLIFLHGNMLDAISSYNQGQPFKDKSGRYKNQEYVDKILKLKEGMDLWF